MRKATKRISLGVIGCILLWQCIARTGIFNPIYFASPYEVLVEAIDMFQHHSIYLDTIFTLKRVGIAIVVSGCIGIPLGIVLGCSSKLYTYLGGILDFLRSIPPIVFYPLLLIMMGSGDTSRIGVAVFGAAIVIIVIIAKGLYQQSSLRRQYVKVMGARRHHIVLDIIWYEALPHTIVAMKTAVSLCIIIIIVTEMMVGAPYGLGSRVQNVQITNNIPDLFMTIIIIGILGAALNKLFIALNKSLVFWKSQ